MLNPVGKGRIVTTFQCCAGIDGKTLKGFAIPKGCEVRIHSPTIVDGQCLELLVGTERVEVTWLSTAESRLRCGMTDSERSLGTYIGVYGT